MNSYLLLLPCLLCLVQAHESQGQGLVQREPRLFYVSTSSSTTTISTLTICFSTTSLASGLTQCKKKRRRSIIQDEIAGDVDSDTITPQRADIEDSGMEVSEDAAQRDPRFLLYWISTTTTSTTTSFTATSTISSIVCTPQGFFSACG